MVLRKGGKLKNAECCYMNGQILEAEKRIFMFRGKARKFRRNGGHKTCKSEKYTEIKSQLINVQ